MAPGRAGGARGLHGRGLARRQLAEGSTAVEIFGEEVAVRAEIHVLDGFSAHADHAELLDWLGHVAAGRPPRVVLTHGEDPERRALAVAIRERFGIVAELPGAGAVLQVQEVPGTGPVRVR